MLIVGGKDYYDGAIAYGVDKSIVFNRARHTESDFIDLSHIGVQFNYQIGLVPPDYKSRDYLYRHDNHILMFVHVIFCGKRYRGLVHRRHSHSGGLFTEYIWRPERAYQIFDSIGVKVGGNYRRTAGENRTSVDQLGQPLQVSNTIEQNLIDHRIAIAISSGLDMARDYKNRDAIWNINTDGLKSVEFAKVVDPYQAFQELSMYIGSTLPQPEKTMVSINEEKYKVDKHGFDKWSFRKIGKKGLQ